MISNHDVAQLQPVVRSHSISMRNNDATKQIVAGIYSIENSQWRWTAGDFSLILAVPRGALTHQTNLLFAFNIPDVIMRRTGPITLSAYLNGAQVGVRTYRAAGAQRFSATIPSESLRESPVAIDFHLDRYVPRGVLEGRELGVVADSVSLESE